MTDAPHKLRVALVQLRCGREVAPNLEAAEALIRRAAAAGARYIQTPENTALMELEHQRLMQRVQTEAESEALSRLRALAAELGVYLHPGSLGIRLDAERVANRSYVLDPKGDIVARYDKLHMFDVDLPGGETYRESNYFQPGRKAVLAEFPFGKLGLSICYDLRFPALYRALACAGATLIACPAAFTKQTGEAHWHTLIRARAIETGSFLLAATQGGLHENGRSTYGHSLIVSPWGEVLAEAGAEPGVVLADLDLAEAEAARTRIPCLQHTREFEIETATLQPGRRAS